jgi:tRNA-splicing ligase RtcB
LAQDWQGKLEKIDDYRWMIPKEFQAGMRVPGLIYADEGLLAHIRQEQSLQQVANVAHLPGIVGYSLAMPDIHWGYGFCIGGVAAFDTDEGVVSPGGVGYDINCGVRVLRTDLLQEDVMDRIKELVNALYQNVPCGVGSTGKLRISKGELKNVLRKGAQWAVSQGYGWNEDLEHTEAGGCLDGADPGEVSDRAIERGRPQLGTLGAGNHFLEIQVVDEVYDDTAAEALGLALNQATVMIHCGSRGLGHQVCDDYVKVLGKATSRYGISIPDRQLACAPITSPDGQRYLKGMACAANYAWANRQMIMHWVRQSFEGVLGRSAEALGMHLIYDVAHNIAKFEEHRVGDRTMTLCVHRKGATRAFAPRHAELPKVYQQMGQPVLIPGDMGTHSYILLGTDRAMEETYGSTCHGAGRVMSRNEAKRVTKGRNIRQEMANKGIYVHARSEGTLHEEVSEAYKNVDHVVEVVHQAGLSRKVARMRPLGVVKG